VSENYHVSPSQIDKYIGCPRAWAARYIAGLPEPTNQSAERGTAVHKVCEDWTLSAKPPDLDTLYGRIAYPALKFIPAPKTPGVLPERKVLWEYDGILWSFIKDLERPGWDTHIWDYKSTKNLKYQKTSEKLTMTDPAGIVYSAHAFVVHQAKSVTLEWLYLTANPPHRCLPVIARPDKQHCLERFAWLNSVARDMIEHRKAKTYWLDLPAGPAYCNAFGGCPHKAACNLSPQDEFRSMMQMSEITTVKPVETAGFLAAISKFATGGQPAAQQAIAAPIPRAALVEAAAVAYPETAQPQAAPPAPVQTIVVPDPPPKLMPWQRVVEPVAAPEPTPAIPDLVLPSDEKPKRKRRTKAEMAAEAEERQISTGRFSAGELFSASKPAEDQEMIVVQSEPPHYPAVREPVSQPEGVSPEPEDMTDRYLSRPVAPIANSASTKRCLDSMLLEQVVIALCHNPGCAAMQSVDIVSKARAIVTAIEAE
jgi:hypothetical protein